MAKAKVCPVCGMKNCTCDHTTKAVPALMGDPRPHKRVTSVFKDAAGNRDGSSIAAEGMSAANYSMHKRDSRAEQWKKNQIADANAWAANASSMGRTSSGWEEIGDRSPAGITRYDVVRSGRPTPGTDRGYAFNLGGKKPNSSAIRATGAKKMAKSAGKSVRKGGGGGDYVPPKYEIGDTSGGGSGKGGKGNGNYAGAPNAGVPPMYPKGNSYTPPPRVSFEVGGGKSGGGDSGGKKPGSMIPTGPTPSSKLPPAPVYRPSPSPTKAKKMSKAMTMPSAGIPSRPMPPKMPPPMPTTAKPFRPATMPPPMASGSGLSPMTKGKKMAKGDGIGQGAYINGKPAQIGKRSK